ncbi:hypothetical protein CNR22_17895 [Sphingobacteriaceae bacterium]|nr:hypothetical protein CNR22_17895 [Sphingobacteriaceae bacterium]
MKKSRVKHSAFVKICLNGHKYYKNTNCPTCPICEADGKPKHGFMCGLSAPARRALETNSIKTLRQLSQFSEKEILAFHGMGPASIPKLRQALNKEGLYFKK